MNPRAIQQRARDAQRSEEEAALKKAHDSDRQAKQQMKKKLKKNNTYLALEDKNARNQMMEQHWEILEQKRYDSKRSGKLSQLFITYFC